MRQIRIFLRFSKVICQFVWLFLCFVRVVNLLVNPFVNLKLFYKLLQLIFRLTPKTISCSVFSSVVSSQILQYTEINIVVHWKFWRKYRRSRIYLAVSHKKGLTELTKLYMHLNGSFTDTFVQVIRNQMRLIYTVIWYAFMNFRHLCWYLFNSDIVIPPTSFMFCKVAVTTPKLPHFHTV